MSSVFLNIFKNILSSSHQGFGGGEDFEMVSLKRRLTSTINTIVKFKNMTCGVSGLIMDDAAKDGYSLKINK